MAGLDPLYFLLSLNTCPRLMPLLLMLQTVAMVARVSAHAGAPPCGYLPAICTWLQPAASPTYTFLCECTLHLASLVFPCLLLGGDLVAMLLLLLLLFFLSPMAAAPH